MSFIKVSAVKNVIFSCYKCERNLEFIQCCITLFAEHLPEMFVPLCEEPPSIIQWLYGYLNSQEVGGFGT